MTESMVCCPLYGGDDNGEAEFSSRKTVAARKAHKCCECREAIAKGTKHESYTGKWDGAMETFRTCLSCVEIRDHFACESGWMFGQVWEQLEESFMLIRLTPNVSMASMKE